MIDNAGKYLLVCDDRGSKSWKSASRIYTLGGFAMAETNRKGLIDVWEDIKYQLCGSCDVELKWSHFFSGRHQNTSENPLQETDPTKWSDLALSALETLFDRANIFPITCIVRKDPTQPESMSEQTRKGVLVLDLKMPLSVLLLQFAWYVGENHGVVGEIWCDQLGSRKEEAHLQGEFTAAITDFTAPRPDDQQLIERVNPTIRFLNSKDEPLIQVADFVSGVIWAAAEGDEQYLAARLHDYAPGGKRTYGIVFIES